MQIAHVVFLLAATVFTLSEAWQRGVICELEPIRMYESSRRDDRDPNGMSTRCIESMKKQVQVQLTAAITYLAMGALFIRDTVNRPGFADMFFSSANSKRDNAVEVIRYLLQRGELNRDLSSLIEDPRPMEDVWMSGLHAMHASLRIETNITRSIRGIIHECETSSDQSEEMFEDHHVVNYLKNGLLRDQYNTQRDLAGKIQTLGKMARTHGTLSEFLFDKKLLNGVPFDTPTSLNSNGVSLYTSTVYVASGSGNGNSGSNGNGNGNGNSGAGTGNSGSGNGNSGNSGGSTGQ